MLSFILGIWKKMFFSSPLFRPLSHFLSFSLSLLLQRLTEVEREREEGRKRKAGERKEEREGCELISSFFTHSSVLFQRFQIFFSLFLSLISLSLSHFLQHDPQETYYRILFFLTSIVTVTTLSLSILTLHFSSFFSFFLFENVSK